jgi:malonyl-CoA/methylmalonyl-CoA synthetase
LFRFSSTLRPIYYESVSRYADNVALIDRHTSYTYGQLYALSRQLSHRLLPICRQQKTIDDTSATSTRRSVQLGVLCPNDASFIIAMWASWMIGATVVPLSLQHPPSSLAYFIDDAQCRGIIVGDDHTNQLIKTTLTNTSQGNLPIINIDRKALVRNAMAGDVSDDLLLSTTAIDRNSRSNALIIYTSGTSGRPKGCVLTFSNVQAHVDSMVKAWGWTQNDGIRSCEINRSIDRLIVCFLVNT